MRICSGCILELDDSEFNERSPGKPYRKCKSCRWLVAKSRMQEDEQYLKKTKLKQKEWYESHKKELSDKRKEYRKATGVGKWYYLWNVYRIRESTYISILESQGGVCAICKKDKRLYVDHDHSCCVGPEACGQCIRGLICQKCNMFMHYVDEYDLFEEALLYSKKRIPNPDSRDSDS